MKRVNHLLKQRRAFCYFFINMLIKISVFFSGIGQNNILQGGYIIMFRPFKLGLWIQTGNGKGVIMVTA